MKGYGSGFGGQANGPNGGYPLRLPLMANLIAGSSTGLSMSDRVGGLLRLAP